LAAVARQAKALEGKVDALVGLTHLALDQDAALTDAVPQLAFVLGGHEHENYQVRRGRKGILVLKGDANARSVFVVRLTFDPATGEVSVHPELVPVTDEIPEDPAVAAEVKRWTDVAFAAFRSAGLDPGKAVADVPVVLDGKESSVRNRSTELTDLVARGMQAEVPGATLAFYNSGSIRIDDEIPPGIVSQYDVIRVLPFGGPVVGVRIRGSLLQQVLDQGIVNRGRGGFLQTSGVLKVSSFGPWEIAGEPLERDRVYVAAVGNYLLTGKEEGFGYLTPENEELEVIGDFRDVRLTLVDEISRTYGP
jgi:5'-nucleotidase / UDP-sugar diphosphatase